METGPNPDAVAPDARQASPRGLIGSPRRLALVFAGILITVLAVLSGILGYLYATTPISIREPLYEHYHFRMQLIVNDSPVNFGEARFQEGYAKDNCNAVLTRHPIHFHDNKNQFVHIHWEGMTGGQVLKYYGWNLIGGPNDTLGYRFDALPRLQKVPIHGNVLPAMPVGANFYVYSGDENGYIERSLEEFADQDLESFFDKISNSPAHELNKQKRPGLADKLLPKAYAHDTDAEHANETHRTMSHEDLKRLNNLIGNVVIFVQQDKPTKAEVQDRFQKLEPLSESSCAG